MNPQEVLWRGPFGDEYQMRSPGDVESNLVMLEHILLELQINSVIEYGAGMGSNLKALRALFTQATLTAVEVNPTALQALRASPLDFEVLELSMLSHLPGGRTWDLAFTKGVLIHVAPEDLPAAYAALYRASSRYILIAEYYNPTPVALYYRGQYNALWKRDFAGEMLERYPQRLRLIDYGFVYHRAQYPQDDLTWMLMEKRQEPDPIGRHP